MSHVLNVSNNSALARPPPPQHGTHTHTFYCCIAIILSITFSSVGVVALVVVTCGTCVVDGDACCMTGVLMLSYSVVIGVWMLDVVTVAAALLVGRAGRGG